MICTTNTFTLSIDPRECIGASLPKINKNFENLSKAVCELSSVSIIPYDSDTIDLSYDPVTRILSADLIENGHITDAMLSAMPPYTVKGNPQMFANTPTNIPAGECSVLGRYNGITAPLAFDKVVNCQIALRTIESDRLVLKTIQNDVIGDDQIDNRTLSAMPPYSVKGNATNNPNIDPQDIEADPYTALVRPNATDNLKWTPAGSDSALIRTATNSLSFVNSPQDSVLMRDQTDLRFVTAPGWSAYLKENGTDPLGFSVAGPDTALFRSDVTDDLSFKFAATDTVFLRDHTHLQFAPVPENSVIARDEQHVRAISALPFSAFIRPGPSNSPDDRLQFRVAQPDSALIRTDTLNLSFAVAPTNSALLRDNDHLRHVSAGTDTALVRTDIGTATQSLSFIPAEERTVLVRKHNDHVEFAKVQYDMFEQKIGTIAEGTVVMWYPTNASRTISHYFETAAGATDCGLGRIDKEYDGWAVCTGRTYTVTYLVGPNAGTTETFRTPDLRSKFIVGAEFNGPGFGAQTNKLVGALTTYNIEDQGGWEKHHLSIPELPKHVHNVSSVDPGHDHSYKQNSKKRLDATWKNEDGANPPKDGVTGKRKTGIKDTAPTGGDLSHENRPPYYALYYIIKLVSGRRNKDWSLGSSTGSPPPPTMLPTATPVPTPVPPPLGHQVFWTNAVGYDITNTFGAWGTTSPTSVYASGNLQEVSSTVYIKNTVLSTPVTLDITGISSGGDVELKNMPSLTKVILNSNVDSLDITGSSNIQQLDISQNKLTSLNVNPCSSSLKVLNCEDNNLLTTVTNLNACSVLEELNCAGCSNMTTATFPAANTIKRVDLTDTKVTNISLANKTNLQYLAASNILNLTIDIKGCSSLQTLDLGGSTFTNLQHDAGTFTKLKSIVLEGSTMSTTDIIAVLNRLTVTNGGLNFGSGYPANLSTAVGYGGATGAKAKAIAKGWSITPSLP